MASHLHRGRRSWRRPWLPFRPIVAGFLIAAGAVVGAVCWVLVGRFGWAGVLAYLAGVNLATFLAYAYDKAVARGAAAPSPDGRPGGARLWRVPESVLHLMALAGGTPAAFAGQRALRHKTAKQSFRVWFWVIVVAQTAALSAWVWYAGGYATR
jgi:uncharacterized membrane protein YsdA (DUF1294 family)